MLVVARHVTYEYTGKFDVHSVISFWEKTAVTWRNIYRETRDCAIAANVLNACVKTSTRKALKDGSTQEKHELSSSGAAL